MMNGDLRELWKMMKVKEFRDAFVDERITTGIAYQIRSLREKKGWSQTQLGEKANKPQSVISRIEDPDYGKFSLQTLKELASTFDVALLVEFVPFSELLERIRDLSPKRLAVTGFHEDRLKEPVGTGAGSAVAAASRMMDQNYASSAKDMAFARRPRELQVGAIRSSHRSRAVGAQGRLVA